MSQQLALLPGSLPPGWCPTSGTGFYQEIYNKFFMLGAALLPTGTGLALKVDDGPRTAEDQGTVVWLRTIGGKPERIYTYYAGYWVSPHPIPPSSDFRMIVAAGSEADVWAMDGGDGTDPATTAPTAVTGAMWEVDHTFDFRMPVGVGTNSDTSNSIAIEEIGGAEEITLTTAQGAQDENHVHTVGRQVADAGSAGDDVALLIGSNVATGAGFVVHGDSNFESKNIEDCTGDYAVTSGVTMDPIEPHSNMPPYKGVWFVKRTIREFYTAA